VAELEQFDVLIVGGGPAGLTAGIYTSRALLKTVLLERAELGGQVSWTDKIENYSAFPEGIGGTALTDRMVEQAKRFGVDIRIEEALKVIPEDGFLRVTSNKREYRSDAVILATGARPRRLGVEGEDRLVGKGVSYCATCDAPLYRNLAAGVVGGGNSAFDEAEYIAKFARKVTIIHIEHVPIATPSLVQRVGQLSNIEQISDSTVSRIDGTDVVERITVKNVKTNEEREIEVDGLFVFIGMQPNADLVKDLVDIDHASYIVANDWMATKVPGVFACGDVRLNATRQITSAVGEGTTAALEAQHYIQEKRTPAEGEEPH